MGTTGYGIYTVSLVSLGSRFSGADLANGTASFAMMWGFGALFGTVSGGWVMLGFGAHGLPISLAVVCFLLGIGVARRQLSQPKSTINGN